MAQRLRQDDSTVAPILQRPPQEQRQHLGLVAEIRVEKTAMQVHDHPAAVDPKRQQQAEVADQTDAILADLDIGVVPFGSELRADRGLLCQPGELVNPETSALVQASTYRGVDMSPFEVVFAVLQELEQGESELLHSGPGRRDRSEDG